MIRVGLVGYGLAGRVFHAPMITAVDGLELVAVVERNSRNAEKLYPWIMTYSSIDDMLAKAQVDLVVIATPNETHTPLALLALEAGRHVVVDKPTAITAEDIAALMARAAEVERLLIPFHNRRWDGDFQTLRKSLREETLGRLVALESTFDRWRPRPNTNAWRESGAPGTGILLDLGTHLIDQALVLFGLPEGVSAEVLRERDTAAAIDSFTVRLRYGGAVAGEMVTLAANCLAAAQRPRYTVRGTHGNFVKHGVDPQEAQLRQSPQVVEPGWGEEPESAWGMLMIDDGESIISRPVQTIAGDYRLFYAGVRDAILGKAAAPVEAIDAWRVARIIEWAEASALEHREIACVW